MSVGVDFTGPYIRRDGALTPHGRCGPQYGHSRKYDTTVSEYIQELCAKILQNYVIFNSYAKRRSSINLHVLLALLPSPLGNYA